MHAAGSHTRTPKGHTLELEPRLATNKKSNFEKKKTALFCHYYCAAYRSVS